MKIKQEEDRNDNDEINCTVTLTPQPSTRHQAGARVASQADRGK